MPEEHQLSPHVVRREHARVCSLLVSPALQVRLAFSVVGAASALVELPPDLRAFDDAVDWEGPGSGSGRVGTAA